MALGRHLVAKHIGSLRWAVAFFVLLLFSSVFAHAAATADALTAQRLTGPVKARNVVLMTDRELITKQGLTAMRRPAG
jgi:hypothetical protein